jgi:hypothetical protein
VNPLRSLTTDMDSLKIAILAAGGLSILAGVAALWQGNRFRTYRDALPAARRNLEAIAVAANQIKALEDEVKSDLGLQADSVTYYITQQATLSSMGDVNAKSRTTPPSKGYLDQLFDVTPPDKAKVYTRQQLATFFYRIENFTSRMRVTKIDLHLDDKRKPEDDTWKFSAEFTTRSRSESPGG